MHTQTHTTAHQQSIPHHTQTHDAITSENAHSSVRCTTTVPSFYRHAQTEQWFSRLPLLLLFGLVCCGCSSGVFSLVLVCYELCALSIRNHVWLAQDGVGCELGSVSHAITLRDTVLHTNNPHTQPNKLTTRRATTSHQEHKTDTPREHAHTTSQPANAMQQRHRAPSEHTCTYVCTRATCHMGAG